MAEFASKGVAGAGLGLGIAGTALGLLNSNGGNGVLGNLFGGGSNSTTGLAETLLMVQAINGNGKSGCSENTPATRWDIEQSEKMAAKDAEISALRVLDASKTYTQAAVVDLSDRLLTKFDGLNNRFCENEKAQAVWNGTMTATVSCLSGQVQSVQSLLDSVTKTVIPSSNVCNNDYPVVVTNSACNPVNTRNVTE